jgi:hypothetical protein
MNVPIGILKLFAVRSIVLLSVLSGLISGCQLDSPDPTKDPQSNEFALAALESEVDSLRAVLYDLYLRPPREHPISLSGLISLRRHGFEDPAEHIISDLCKHPEIIPHEPILGSTSMHFWEKEAFVLSDRWVFAYFEDGHYGGYGIFEYRIDEDGAISWESVVTYTD